MNSSDPPPHPASNNHHNLGDDESLVAEKQTKKIRVSPPSHTDNNNDHEAVHKLLDKPAHSIPQPSPPSPPPTSLRAASNNNTNTNNNIGTNNNHNNRHETPEATPLSLEDGLYHKRTPKGAKKMKKDPHTWGTRLRTHPKPVVRFGTPSQPSSPSFNDEEGDSIQDKPDFIASSSSASSSSPPSSPHPPDDTPLETLLKHGSGWTFPREQNGKMICIFRSCPQPLRAGAKKDYIDHLRLHQTMEHTPIYSMLRHALPGGLVQVEGSADTTEESNVSQVDGEWEGDEDEADEGDEGGGGQSGGSGGAAGEEELHTPKLSQRGLQLRAQMMRYGLNIFRQDSEGRYLCFFMGCTMRMTTNFSRHIAKHEKKLDAISPDLVHLLKEGVEKPYPKLIVFYSYRYIKPDKKVKGEPSQMPPSLSLMMPSSTHLIPPPHPHHSMDGLHRPDGTDLSDHHAQHHISTLDMQREYHQHRPPTPHMHVQHSLQHLHLQQASPPNQSMQYMQHISPHTSKLNLPPPPHPLAHSHPPNQPMQMQYRHPTHIENPLHRPPPTSSSPVVGHSPNTNPSEIRWVYRSPLPSPLTLPINSPRRPSLPYDPDTPPSLSHSPSKKPALGHHSFPPLSTSSPRTHAHPGLPSPAPSLPRLASDGDPPFSNDHLKPTSSEHPYPYQPSSDSLHSDQLKAPLSPSHPVRPQQENNDLGALGAVATSLLDLRKM